MSAPLMVERQADENVHASGRAGLARGRVAVVRPSLFLASGVFRVILAMLLTGVIWWLLSSVLLV